MQNGKGDKSRVTDRKAYRDGWDAAFATCPVHPRYRPHSRPADRCKKCWDIYYEASLKGKRKNA